LLPTQRLILRLNSRFKKTEVIAKLKVPLRELELAFRKGLSDSPKDSVSKFQSELKAYIRSHLSLHSEGGELWQLSLESDLTAAGNESSADLDCRLKLVPPQFEVPRKFTLVSDLVQHEVVNHQLFVVLSQDFKYQRSPSEAHILGVASYLHNSVVIDRPQWTVDEFPRAPTKPSPDP